MIQQTYHVQAVTQLDGSLKNIFGLIENGCYFNWTILEGHAGDIVSAMNKQLLQYNLKMILGVFPRRYRNDLEMAGCIVPLSTTEDQDLTMEIDLDAKTYRVIS